jgi:hypothetical protein
MNRDTAALQTVQGVLQKDERLLWWGYPRLRHIREPLRVTDILFLVFTGLIITFFFILWTRFLLKINFYFIEYIKIFVAFWLFSVLVMSLRVWLRSFTTALKKAPPYRRYTFYALTDQRILIIIALPGISPSVFTYLPREMNQPTSIVHPDGSGIVIFSTPRQVKLSSYGKDITLPGSFVGIPNAQHVTDLLRQLKARSE